jgi:hypothetical protein
MFSLYYTAYEFQYSKNILIDGILIITIYTSIMELSSFKHLKKLNNWEMGNHLGRFTFSLLINASFGWISG